MRPDGQGTENQSRRRHSAMPGSRQDESGDVKVSYGGDIEALRGLAKQLPVQKDLNIPFRPSATS
jgi:hypothetical protein